MTEQPEARPAGAAGGWVIGPGGEGLPHRIGIDGGPMMPCRIVAMDTVPDRGGPLVSGVREPDGTLRLDRVSLPDLPAGQSAAERVGSFVAEAWGADGTWPPGDAVFEFTVDTRAFTAALARWAAACTGLVEAVRPISEQAGRLGEAVRPVAQSVRAAAGLLDPELQMARHWPAQGDVCAHVCGPDPGHVCDARAITTLRHPLPSGGIRDLPLCGPCAAAEGALEDEATMSAAEWIRRRA